MSKLYYNLSIVIEQVGLTEKRNKFKNFMMIINNHFIIIIESTSLFIIICEYSNKYNSSKKC